MRLIDIENIDYVRLEDSLHCLEHHKGDEVECVICAPTVEAIPKSDYKTRLKADMVAMLEELLKELKELPKARFYETNEFGDVTGYIDYPAISKNALDIMQQKINALKGVEDGNEAI